MMNKSSAVLALLLPLFSVGCHPGQGSSKNQVSAADATHQAGDKSSVKTNSMNDLAPPSPSIVLHMIYQRDGDGAVSYEIDNGVLVSYWYGQKFELNGKRYFVGFANSTEENSGEGGSGLLEPGNVAISQATFEQVGGANDAAWKQVDSDGYVGQFGAADQADDVDTKRKAISHVTRDGRLLLAVPTVRFTQGVEESAYALLLFDPNNVDKLSFRRWGYLGSIISGENNSASCDDEGGVPCVTSSGVLSFDAAGSTYLPTLRMNFSGKTLSDSGQVRELGPSDTVEYIFDVKTEGYQK